MKEFLYIVGYNFLYIIFYFAFYITSAYVEAETDILSFQYSHAVFRFSEWFIYFILFAVFYFILKGKYNKRKISKSLFVTTLVVMIILFIPVFDKKCGQERFSGFGFTDSKKTNLFHTLGTINMECKIQYLL